MSGLFGNLLFLNPWILAGLGALPVLWYLLRITPPSPKLIKLPTTRFFKDLIPDKQTPSHTPWWILLLRMVIAALIILALAGPVYNPASQLPGNGPVRLVLDNGWAAAQSWDQQMNAAEEILSQAGREDRDIYILTTAPEAGQDTPQHFGPLSLGQARSTLRGLTPLPWPEHYKGAETLVLEKQADRNIYSVWLGHGLQDAGLQDLAQTLSRQGGLSYIEPKPSNLPLILKRSDERGGPLEIMVDGPSASFSGRPARVQAMGEDGRVFDQISLTLTPDEKPARAQFDLPDNIASEISQYRLAGQSGVGGVYYFDNRFRKRTVGILGPGDEADVKPFIEARYFLNRALEPFANLIEGDIETLIEENPAMIILNDVTSMPASTLNALESWVQDGGLLLRFSGPNMAQADQQIFLTPVSLMLGGGRSLSGSLSWEKPAKLSEFDEKSPFYGTKIFEPIEVRQQILAQPSAEIEEKSWARLEDGTPLITADRRERGLIVMVHTTASPEWSDFVLSGVFVEILQRLLNMAGRSEGYTQNLEDGFLQPIWVFDGFGAIQSPDASVKPIPAQDIADVTPSASHPPGLYGRGGFHHILNMGDHVDRLRSVSNLPLGVQRTVYGGSYEKDLMPYLLYAALGLILLDWLIMSLLALGFSLKSLQRMGVSAALLFALLTLPTQNAAAQNQMDYANGLYLAYIRTGDTALDLRTSQGLNNLSVILSRRTSVEPDGVAAIDPERDELAFFPMIYWAISTNQKPLSDDALENIQNYLDHGGTILFDTRDQNRSSNNLAGTQNSAHLKKMIGSLNIPALTPIPEDHVLGKSFYLLDDYAGRYSGGTIWVAENSGNGRDGVSSVIIGSHDWAESWASADPRRLAFNTGSRQRELSFRFGVNLMMYALTGNYKADQVHVPHILERLGQ